MTSIASTVLERTLPHGGRVFAARTATKDVVTVVGSVLGGSHHLPRALGQIPSLVTELLDAGTRLHGKRELRELMASRGISISFEPGGDRTYFQASCLPEDLALTLDLVARCLGTATLSQSELAKAKQRFHGDLLEEETNTKAQAQIALAQMLYDAKHPHYLESTATRRKQLTAATRSELVAFQKMLGQGGLLLAVVGDIDAGKALKAVEKAFATLPVGTTQKPPLQPYQKGAAVAETRITISDKANIDTYLGVALSLTYEDTIFLPFQLMTEMLGGGGLASGHLMRTVRERDGLTYGIYAGGVGFGDGRDGYFRISATFSPDTFDTAVKTTRAEVRAFQAAGVTTAALADQKSRTIGRYLVGLSTTSALAGVLHMIGAQGKQLSYIDEYPELVQAVTLKKVKEAAALIPLDKLSLAAAGTFTMKASGLSTIARS